jgi:hypothetical protein
MSIVDIISQKYTHSVLMYSLLLFKDYTIEIIKTQSTYSL